MAFRLLLGTATLAVVGGLLQARQSVFWLYVSIPLALGAIVGHVLASAWPPGRAEADDDNPGWRARAVVGLVVGLVGFGSGVGLGTVEPAWFGHPVSAAVVDSRDACSVEAGWCTRMYRLASVSTGADLGWVSLCGAKASPAERVDVDVDPLGWVPPTAASCAGRHRLTTIMLRCWAAGLLAIVAMRATVAWRIHQRRRRDQ